MFSHVPKAASPFGTRTCRAYPRLSKEMSRMRADRCRLLNRGQQRSSPIKRPYVDDLPLRSNLRITSFFQQQFPTEASSRRQNFRATCATDGLPKIMGDARTTSKTHASRLAPKSTKCNLEKHSHHVHNTQGVCRSTTGTCMTALGRSNEHFTASSCLAFDEDVLGSNNLRCWMTPLTS